MGTLAVEARGNEAWAGVCDVAAPGELAGNEAWVGAAVVVSSAWGVSVELPGPLGAAGVSSEW